MIDCCRVSDDEFDGESNVTPPTGWNATQAMSNALVVTHSLLIPPGEQGKDLKEEEKVSYGEIIREVIKILSPEIFPRKQEDTGPAITKSGIEVLTPGAGIKDDPPLPQSTVVLQTIILYGWRLQNQGPDGLRFLHWKRSLHQWTITRPPTSALPKLDSDVSKLDLSNPSSITISSENLDRLEWQVMNLVSINSHSDLFASTACQSLSSIKMDSTFLTYSYKSVRHSVAISCHRTTEDRRDANHVLVTPCII